MFKDGFMLLFYYKGIKNVNVKMFFKGASAFRIT